MNVFVLLQLSMFTDSSDFHSNDPPTKALNECM